MNRVSMGKEEQQFGHGDDDDVVVVVVLKVCADFSSFSCSILFFEKKKKRYAFVSMLSCKEKRHQNQKMPKLLKSKAKKNAR